MIESQYVYILQLLALPILLHFYAQGNVFFWILFIFVDIVHLMLLDMEQLVMIVVKGEHKEEMKKLVFYNGAILLAYVVIMIKIFPLGLLLMLNDIVIGMLNFSIHMKKNKK